jgi:RNA polymerase primary sigma factor
MPKIQNKDLAELAHQLVLSPKRQRLGQVRGIEKLLGLIESGKSYPYDMVCYHITGYQNRRSPAKSAIPADALTQDLIAMAEHITRKTAIPVADIDEGHTTCDDLATKLEVSTKTIRRWRDRGLMGIRAVFEDGVSRLIYLDSTVKRFVKDNAELVERGAAFKQLTPEEKQGIIKLARELLSRKRMKLHIVARTISERTGRAVETIRYTLRRYDEAHPEKALFANGGLPMVSEEHRRIWRAHQKGETAVAIVERTGLSSDTVSQIIREMTVRSLKADKPVCVYNELFDAPDAEDIILNALRPEADPDARRTRAPRDLPAYLRSLYEIPLMTAEQEVDAFRRYNYLKFKAARMIDALDPCDVTEAELKAVANVTGRYESIRQELVQANLRLVVSIAKKHVGWSPSFFETVSDGNMSLMRAVERFDYARGFKFSTYASWAIMKNYARTVPEQHYHFGRYITGQDELLDAAPDHRETDRSSMDDAKLVEYLEEGMSDLTERERTIVTAHFGLFGAASSQTLEELGKRFGVTKERVRQIERRAIGKIRGALSPAAAEMLPD